MSHKPNDLTRPADLRHSQFSGARRSRRPLYVDLLPPCNHACPAGENIQGWLAELQQGNPRRAFEVLVEDNPLPAVHGRVCYHPCEDACNRVQVDATVSIHAVERFLGDLAIEQSWPAPAPAPASGKKVLVVGAGPSGLSAAYHLARFGHSVEIRAAGPVAGGMMHFGIPAYRLPRAVLDAEVARIADLGVRITLNHKVEDLLAERSAGGFDAVFIAIGAHLSKRVEIPARDAPRMLDAVAFLESVERGDAPLLGRRVAVYGGGNTAMDAARVAARLGATEPLIIYRRDRAHMPAHDFEADEALAEGVKINWLRSITEIDGSAIKVEKMRVDEAGRPRPTGEFEVLEADALIMALGQSVDAALLEGVPGIEFEGDGTVRVDERMMTGAEGIFAGGDMVPAERTVTVATGHGKKAARHIDAWLRGERYAPPPKHDLATFDKLKIWYLTDAAQRSQPRLDPDRRREGFAEVVGGLSAEQADYEVRRCLSCGNCFECDVCYAACPEDAIERHGRGNRYRFDFDKCTGCAVCFEQCPCHAIEMIPEPTG